jgi:hypothetical protein
MVSSIPQVFPGYLKAYASQPATGQGEGKEQREVERHCKSYLHLLKLAPKCLALLLSSFLLSLFFFFFCFFLYSF